MDFLERLNKDMVLNIFMLLDPADLVRASAVSRHWKDLVIGSELCKQQCLRQFPQVADLVDVSDVTNQKRKRTRVAVDHNVFTLLLHLLQKLKSSSVHHCKKVKHSASYYENKRKEDDNAIPEKFIFKLISELCVITEIDMIPYREYFQGIEDEDYSTKSVRFRMGFPKSALGKRYDFKWDFFNSADEFIWTYTSPEFPMGEVCKPLPRGTGHGQRFELPEAVLCIGGFVMVELLGQVQMDENKGPYYIKIKDVHVLGRSLAPAFEAKVRDISGKFDLTYDSTKLEQTIQMPSDEKYFIFSLIDDEYSDDDVECACACQLV